MTPSEFEHMGGDDWTADFAEQLADIMEYLEDKYGEDWMFDLDFDDPEAWEVFREAYDTLYG